MKFYRSPLAAEGKIMQKHFFAVLPISISGKTKWLEMVGVEYCKERVFDYDCPVACSWLEWVPKRFVRADPFGYVYYRRYLNEIKYGENKLAGFLLRRLSLMIWGRCDDCQAIRRMNGRCPNAKEPMPSSMSETKCRKCGETCATMTLEAFACDNCGDEYRTVREPGYTQLETELADKDRQLAEARAEIERKDKLLSIVGEVANNALYFNDNSDYEKALWEILAAAKPELFAECEMPRLKFISTSNETAKKGN